jgi:hypothetical protein
MSFSPAYRTTLSGLRHSLRSASTSARPGRANQRSCISPHVNSQGNVQRCAISKRGLQSSSASELPVNFNEAARSSRSRWTKVALATGALISVSPLLPLSYHLDLQFVQCGMLTLPLCCCISVDLPSHCQPDLPRCSCGSHFPT